MVQFASPVRGHDENICWAIAVLGSDRPILGRRQRQVEVLLVQPDTEARIEGAVDHPLAVHLQDAEEANPPISAARTLAGSAPALAAKTRASDTAWMFRATMIWLATLQVWPSPFSRHG